MDIQREPYLTRDVIGLAIEVHRRLLESAYEECLCYELHHAGVPFVSRKKLPIRYKVVELNCQHTMDVVVDAHLVIEIKAVAPISQAQLLTYLWLGGYRLGLLLNFNHAVLKDEITRLPL